MLYWIYMIYNMMGGYIGEVYFVFNMIIIYEELF